jgi:hypothetical protein
MLLKFYYVGLAAFVVLWVANVIWAFRDARSRGRSGVLVALLVMWSFPIGMLLWMLFRPERLEAAKASEPLPEAGTPAGDPDATLKARANAGQL